jgi:hypothetical protein
MPKRPILNTLGKHTMEEKKQPLFTRARLVEINNDEIGNCTIGEAISRNVSILRTHFFEPLFEYDYLKLLNDVSSVTSNLALQAELEQNWDNEVNELDEETNIALKLARYASLYIELARSAESRNEHIKAWAFNNYATLMVGEILEKSVAIQNRTGIENLSKQNSKNAQGRNKSILQVKEETARLLFEKRPETGWPSKAKVPAALEHPLADFIEKNKILVLRTSNIEQWMKKWLREDELVKGAWEKNKSSKKRITVRLKP